MNKRELNPKRVIYYTGDGIGSKVIISEGNHHIVTNMILKANGFGTLSIVRPDGTIYAKQCTKCGDMYELESSFHKARRDDGSERYHSHCASCRRTDITGYNSIRVKEESYPQYPQETALDENVSQLIELAIKAGYGETPLPELLLRYARGVEGVSAETLEEQAENEDFLNYLVTGVSDYLKDSFNILPSISDILLADFEELYLPKETSKSEEPIEDDEEDEDYSEPTVAPRGKLSIEGVSISVTPEGEINIDIDKIDFEG